MNEFDLQRLRIKPANKETSNFNLKAVIIIICLAFGLLLLLLTFILKQKILFKENKVESNQCLEDEKLIKNDNSISSSNVLLVTGGYIESQKLVILSSKTQGIIKSINFEEGEIVKAGEIISELNSESYILELRMIKAEIQIINGSLEDKNAEYKLAEMQFNSSLSLYEASACSYEDFKKAETNLLKIKAQIESIEGQLEKTKAQLDYARMNISNCKIRAPFTGTIIEKRMNEGELYAPQMIGDKNGIVAFARLDSLRVWADLNETEMLRIKKNQKITIVPDADQMRKYQGNICLILPSLNREKGTVRIKADINDVDEFLKPNMSVKITFHVN